MSDPPPWNWRKLDAKRAADTWKTLAEFVGWLVERYDLGDVIPACWWCHGAITEELTALWLSWIVAYADPEAEPDACRLYGTRDSRGAVRASPSGTEWDVPSAVTVAAPPPSGPSTKTFLAALSRMTARSGPARTA